jgi:excisionase family DNA binding protein
MAENYLTVAAVAEILKLNPQTVRNWIDQGSLPAIHVGRRVRIRRSDFDQLIADGYTRVRTAGEPPEPAPSIWEGHVPPPALP